VGATLSLALVCKESRALKLKMLTLLLGAECETDADCGFALIICNDGVCGL
jgi:hypothetical protein